MDFEISSRINKNATFKEKIKNELSFLFQLSPCIDIDGNSVFYVLIFCKKAPSFLEWVKGEEGLVVFDDSRILGETIVYRSDNKCSKIKEIDRFNEVNVLKFFEKNGYNCNFDERILIVE